MQDSETFRRAHISTKDFPEGSRLAMWREIYGRGIANVDIEPLGDEPFHAEVAFERLPNVSIAAGSRSPAHYRISRELARGCKDIIGISVLRSGAASATQFGRELISGVGSASVLAPTDPSTSTMLTKGSFVTIALSLPVISLLAPDYSHAFGRSIPSSDSALRLLTRYIDTLQTGDELANPQLGQSASDHITDLAALALGARGDYADMAWQRGGTAGRLGAIKSDILRSLGRNDLSTELIAVRHGISPRYVRKLFEQAGSSFSAFVLTERVVKAHRMLIDRRYAHLNIAQIAHESGFGDVSYFNRVFRRHFGATPSDFREAARQAW